MNFVTFVTIIYVYFLIEGMEEVGCSNFFNTIKFYYDVIYINPWFSDILQVSLTYQKKW